MDATDLATEIAAVRAQLIQIATAIAELVDPTVKSYSLDSGQTIQRRETHTLRDLIVYQDSLRNSLATLCARQTGSGTTLVVPAGPRGGYRRW